MQYSATQPLAMILPLPVRKDICVSDMLKFEKIPSNVFSGLKHSFRPKVRGLVSLARSLGKDIEFLAVHQVGSYEASFVPEPDEFSRLDPRFRLSSSLMDQLGCYEDYGFAVFQLRLGTEVSHPMGIRFESRFDDRVFIPTLHVHDNSLPDSAEFDHTIYCQLPSDESRFAKIKGWGKSNYCPSKDRVPDCVNTSRKVFRKEISGMQPNTDTWFNW